MSRKYFGGYCPKAYEESVVLGGALVLHPVPNPPDIAATLHVYTQRIWDIAYEKGKGDAQREMREALGLGK